MMVEIQINIIRLLLRKKTNSKTLTKVPYSILGMIIIDKTEAILFINNLIQPMARVVPIWTVLKIPISRWSINLIFNNHFQCMVTTNIVIYQILMALEYQGISWAAWIKYRHQFQVSQVHQVLKDLRGQCNSLCKDSMETHQEIQVLKKVTEVYKITTILSISVETQHSKRYLK